MANGLEPIGFLENQEFALDTRSRGALDVAKQFVIKDDPSRLAAGQLLKIVKALQAEVKRDREPERLTAKATLDAIVAGRNKHLLPLQEAEKIIKAKQIADEDAQDRLRREEQVRQDEQARLAQQEAEEQAAAMAACIEEETGDTLQAQAIREAPTQAPLAVTLPDTKPKVSGQHTVVHWKCRLKNFDDVPRGLLQFNQVEANRWVADIKENLTRKTSDNGGRPTLDDTAIKRIAELPNGTVLTAEIIGETIPGLEIYIEKLRASTARY